MLYDLKINNKTFYNYELDEFIKNLEKIEKKEEIQEINYI